MTRVLLVDDDDDSTSLLGTLLSRKGYEVSVARSVLEATAQLSNGTVFDVVVTDHQLGDGDARDVLKLRGTARGVVLTGHSSVPVGPETVVLTKPVDVPRLLGVLSGGA